jgi:hypothetical protein
MLETLTSTRTPFVAFVGAGASAMPPSRLPTWKGFNDLLLECLCERLNEYSSNRQPTAEMLAAFRERRDNTSFLAPDFQAQIMEEQVGADYFAVWQSLDTNEFGPVHAGLAELASRGRLAAVITTNFDRLIEAALESRGVPFRAVHDAPGFAALAGVVNGDLGALPIVKIHGSIEDSSSLVDTLRQRLAGRPEALGVVLNALLRRAPWLYLGFSGADFSYDPHYLGVLDAAADARGFVFVRRPGHELEPGVAKLVEAYGAAKTTVAEGDLEQWLARTFELPPWRAPETSAPEPDVDASARVKSRIRAWAEKLGPLAVVNIVCAMLKSVGLEHEAFWLLRKTFKSYRTPDDTESRSYPRYNYNYGSSLLDAGLIRNPLTRAEDGSNLMEWKTYADQNAFEFLARSYKQGNLLAAGGQLASLMAYRGEVGRAIALASAVTEEAVKQEAWLDVCDIAIASVVIYDVVQVFGSAAQQLRFCVERAKKLGDEPRRALLSAHLGRLLTYARDFAGADAALSEAETIAGRLDLRNARIAARAARGLWLVASGKSSEQAFRELESLAGELRAGDERPLVTHYDLAQPDAAPTVLTGHQPATCRVLLDLLEAAMAVGDTESINSTLDRLDELTVEHFQGYIPHYYFAYAQILVQSEPSRPDKALDLVSRAKQIGETSGNPWPAQHAARLEKWIAERSPKR